MWEIERSFTTKEKLMTKKTDLLDKAKELKLAITEKNTIAEIEEAIKKAGEKTKEEPVKKPAIAKAGKRSAKAIAEAEQESEKNARKEAIKAETETEVKKGPRAVAHSKLSRRGKKYQAIAKLVDKTKSYSLDEASKLIVKTNPSKFDASVEISVRLGVDPRQSDQNIRTTVTLPNGTGKKIRVAVFAPESEHEAAKKAGADIIGADDFLQKLEKQELDFDVLIATPQFMPKLGRHARLLGPRGLMPNPKSGTVTTDIAKAVKEAKTGKVEYRVDKEAIVHLSIGKVSFGSEKILENLNSFFESLKSQRPSSLKGNYIKSISLSTTQGPSLKIENSYN